MALLEHVEALKQTVHSWMERLQLKQRRFEGLAGHSTVCWALEACCRLMHQLALAQALPCAGWCRDLSRASLQS